MEFSSDALLECLRTWPAPARYVVLASGGRDSTVLLHALARIREHLPAPLAVLHFDHGLAPESSAWAQRVRAAAAALGIPFFAEKLGLAPGGAVEMRARTARYGRLGIWMQAGDCCLSAHHADDQAETFLLQALRGAGPAGLAGMPVLTRFGRGWLGRPLMRWTREELGAWAVTQELTWVEDPGNRDMASPRNWLRHEIWPRLRARWPAAARTLARSAELAAEADALAAEVAAMDLGRALAPDGVRLSVAQLMALSAARRHNALRHWLRRRGMPLPPARKLAELEATMIMADPGSRAVLRWAGAEARRYRGILHVMPPWPSPPSGRFPLAPGGSVALGRLGKIRLVADPQGPLAESIATLPLAIGFREGGERLRPADVRHHRPLKKLLQEMEVLPWMRPRLPLLYAGGDLAAVADLVVAAPFAGRGWRLVWDDAPPVK